MLNMFSKYRDDWMTRASIQEELGRDGAGWRRMVEEQEVKIVLLLEQADRDGIEVPDVPTVGSIPTRFKMREEIAQLQAALVRKDEEATAAWSYGDHAKRDAAEVRKHLAKECVTFCQARERLEFEVATLQWAVAAAVGVALLGWLR